MSSVAIDNINMVDFVGTKDDCAFCSISDHLDWSRETEHLYFLQEKINRYLDFICSGEMIERFPETKDKKVVIEIGFKYMYTNSPNVLNFLEYVDELLRYQNISLEYFILEDDEESQC